LSIAIAGGCSRNAVEFAVLYPGEEALSWAFCAPRLDDAPKVEAVWRRLAQRGGIPVATGPLQGRLDTAEAGLVRDWARDAANSDMPVPVEVVVDSVVLGSTLAKPLPRRPRNRRLWPRPARLRIPFSRATRL
jgi:O-antigen biosynthesis protein